MGLTCQVSIAGTGFRFEDFGTDSFWNTWHWKLDTFRAARQSTVPDVVIRGAADDKTERDSAVLSSENSGFFRREVLRTADGGTLWRLVRNVSDEVCLAYRVSADFKEVTLLTDRTASCGAMSFEYLGQMIPFVQLNQSVLSFHGALVEYAGQAFAVCAPSGVGKTTHARLWRDCRNALILNGDRSVFRKEADRWIAWGTPWSGTSGEQINRSAPLRALVLLERGSENHARRLTPQTAFRAMFPHLLYPAWDGELTGKALDLLDELLREIPVYHLTCRPDAEAVQTLCREVFG